MHAPGRRVEQAPTAWHITTRAWAVPWVPATTFATVDRTPDITRVLALAVFTSSLSQVSLAHGGLLGVFRPPVVPYPPSIHLIGSIPRGGIIIEINANY